jgi:hypothetical protein
MNPKIMALVALAVYGAIVVGTMLLWVGEWIASKVLQ